MIYGRCNMLGVIEIYIILPLMNMVKAVQYEHP